MATKEEESKQIYFFDVSTLLLRYQTRENGIRQINEIFTSYSQVYTSGLIFGEVVGELKRTLNAESAEKMIPLLLGDVKSGRLRVLEIKPGSVEEEVAEIRQVQGRFPLKPLEIFHLAITRFFLKSLRGGKEPVFVSLEERYIDVIKELGHSTLLVEP